MRQYGYVGLALVAAALVNAPLRAQTLAEVASDSLVRNARGCKPTPTPRQCRAFVLTNLGAYSSFDHSGYGGPEYQAVADLGFLVNVGTQSALGASFYVSAGKDLLVIGPTLRYRRWLDGARSLDFGLGVGVVNDTPNKLSTLGLIKFNVDERIGIALRPEYLTAVRTDCTPLACTFEPEQVPRVSVGLEVGGGTGRKVFGVLAVTAAIVGIAAMIALQNGSFGPIL